MFEENMMIPSRWVEPVPFPLHKEEVVSESASFHFVSPCNHTSFQTRTGLAKALKKLPERVERRCDVLFKFSSGDLCSVLFLFFLPR